MKNKTKSTAPIRSQFHVLRQICHLIPVPLAPKLARETGVEPLCRTFSAWSHCVAMLFAQFTHALGLNDGCDSLRLHSGPLSSLRAATPPSRNNLSHASRHRPALLAETLFWSVLGHWQSLAPGFARGRSRLMHRFKASIHVVDSTVLALIASCVSWAGHRRRKAAAKCHLRMDLRSQLPRFAIIDTARENEARRARELCAAIRAGEMVIFDKAYVDFAPLLDLAVRGVFWVTRARDDFRRRVAERRLKKPEGQILCDDLVRPAGGLSRRKYPAVLRPVIALVEVDGQERAMVFITNHVSWAASSVAGLYRCRWQIECFFKQIKQTLQGGDFLGNSANAVRWQLWSALLCYVLLRFLAHVSRWAHSFTRLWAVCRSALWQRLDLRALLERYGTAGGDFQCLGQPEQAWLPGLRPRAVG